jgi:large subunit ribosomal protein L18
MSLIRKNRQRKLRKQNRVRKKFKESSRPRVSIFRSSTHIYAQLVDDQAGKTLASSSTLILKELAGDKTNRAHAVGKSLAEKAKQLGVETVVFDRGRFKYHGRVKAVAEGLREGGLQV